MRTKEEERKRGLGWEPHKDGWVRYISPEEAAIGKKLNDAYEACRIRKELGPWAGEPRWDVTDGWYFMQEGVAEVFGPFEIRDVAGAIGRGIR